MYSGTPTSTCASTCRRRGEKTPTKPDWEKALKAAQSPLETLQLRKVKSATFAQTLPGGPDGEYVVIQYDSQFENKASAIETVTPMHEKDGAWKVAGYCIK